MTQSNTPYEATDRAVDDLRPPALGEIGDALDQPAHRQSLGRGAARDVQENRFADALEGDRTDRRVVDRLAAGGVHDGLADQHFARARVLGDA